MFFLGTFIEYPGKIAKSCPLHELFVNFRPQIFHLAEIASVGGQPSHPRLIYRICFAALRRLSARKGLRQVVGALFLCV